jgi:hypothetical protein
MNRLVRGRGHTYRIDGQRVPSVTGVLRMLDSPALIGWAARMSAGYAIDHWEQLSDKLISERYRLIEDARFESNRGARERGKRVHSMAERLGISGEVDVPDELRGQVESVARFLDHWEMRTILAEVACASTEHMYAGTLDTVLECPKLGTVMIDWKVGGKGPYQDNALQLAGYRNTNIRLERVEQVGPRGGHKLIDVEHPMIKVDACFVAKVLADDVELYPVRTDTRERDTFLYLREIWEWHQAATDHRSDNYDPPIDEPIYPEQIPDPDSESRTA